MYSAATEPVNLEWKLSFSMCLYQAYRQSRAFAFVIVPEHVTVTTSCVTRCLECQVSSQDDLQCIEGRPSLMYKFCATLQKGLELWAFGVLFCLGLFMFN